MTKMIGGSDNTEPPLKATFTPKTGVPAAAQQQPVVDQAAKAHLAEQSHRLDISKSKLPASELAALSVHFKAQEAAPERPAAAGEPIDLGTFKQADVQPIYGAPPPIKLPKRLLDGTWPAPAEIRLIYGAPAPSRLPEELQRGKAKDGEQKPDKDQDPHQIEPRLIYGAPAPTRQKDGQKDKDKDWHFIHDLTPTWPNRMMLIYGAPTIAKIGKDF